MYIYTVPASACKLSYSKSLPNYPNISYSLQKCGIPKVLWLTGSAHRDNTVYSRSMGCISNASVVLPRSWYIYISIDVAWSGARTKCWTLCVLLQISAGVNVGLWVQIGNNRQGVNKKVCATCASVLVAICILLHWVCIYKVLTGNPVACIYCQTPG